MKKLHSKLSGIAPFIFFPLLLIFQKGKRNAYVFTFLILFTLSSCYLNFYRTNTKPSIDAGTVSKLSSESKYFIIHFKNSTNGLENVYVKSDSLYGTLVPLPTAHAKYLYPGVNNPKNRLKYVDKPNALIEVHLYSNAEKKIDDSLFSALVSSFNRADVYELNKSATSTNHILSTVGMVATVAAVVGIIAAASFSPRDHTTVDTGQGCNCPQVYIENNGDYSFASGLYSGAVYSTLERMDYLPLKTVAADTKNISFKIANAKNEEQYINQVQLLQVNHPAETNVLANRQGNILSFQKTVAPLTASADTADVKTILAQTDDLYYSFSNRANDHGFSDVVLTFNKPVNTDEAKLVIHARNTMWGGLLHKDFIGLFGDSYEKWRAKKEQADPAELAKWQTDQAMSLMVYLKTAEGWKFVDYFPMIGNTASRDMIMKINTKDITADKIELKLETVYRFWDLDFAGIDYSADQNFETTVINPSKAVKTDGTDQKEILQTSDKLYSHLTGEESIAFSYAIPGATQNNLSSYFLVSGGYYHNLEPVTGKTNYKELYKFRSKGAFDKYSREKYQEAQNFTALFQQRN